MPVLYWPHDRHDRPSRGCARKAVGEAKQRGVSIDLVIAELAEALPAESAVAPPSRDLANWTKNVHLCYLDPDVDRPLLIQKDSSEVTER